MMRDDGRFLKGRLHLRIRALMLVGLLLALTLSCYGLDPKDVQQRRRAQSAPYNPGSDEADSEREAARTEPSRPILTALDADFAYNAAYHAVSPLQKDNCKWELHRKILGAGSFGYVFLLDKVCRVTVNGETYVARQYRAVKVGKKIDAFSTESMKVECNAYYNLCGPHVVCSGEGGFLEGSPLNEEGGGSKAPVCVMEAGKSTVLKWITDRFPKPVRDIKEFLKQALLGLYWLNERDMAHNDIKPNNIFLMNDGESFTIKLGDLGMASAIRRLESGAAYTVVRQQVPAYFHPDLQESIDSARTDSRHSTKFFGYGVNDIFALAVTTIEMLIGNGQYIKSLNKPLFDRLSNNQARMSILDEQAVYMQFHREVTLKEALELDASGQPRMFENRLSDENEGWESLFDVLRDMLLPLKGNTEKLRADYLLEKHFFRDKECISGGKIDSFENSFENAQKKTDTCSHIYTFGVSGNIECKVVSYANGPERVPAIIRNVCKLESGLWGVFIQGISDPWSKAFFTPRPHKQFMDLIPKVIHVEPSVQGGIEEEKAWMIKNLSTVLGEKLHLWLSSPQYGVNWVKHGEVFG